MDGVNNAKKSLQYMKNKVYGILLKIKKVRNANDCTAPMSVVSSFISSIIFIKLL